jgi:hypothetical protein
VSYTIASLFDIQLLDPKIFGVDYWGGIIAGFLYLIYFIMMPIRIKEERERQNLLLPLSFKQIAVSDALYFGLPLLLTLVYLLFFHVTIFSLWVEQSASASAQIGIFSLVVTSFIMVRQIWYANYFKSAALKYVSVLAALIGIAAEIFIVFFLLRQFSYEIFGWYYGKVIFYAPTLVNLFLAYKFFLSRKTYLS